jgi:hypothetical protein
LDVEGLVRLMTPRSGAVRLLSGLAGCVLVVGACGTSSTGPSAPSSVSGILGGVGTVGPTPVTGSLQNGVAPTPNSGPPIGATSGSSASGGSTNVVTLSSGGGPFQTVFVSTGSGSVAASALGRGRAETVASGFYEIDLPSPVSSLSLDVSYASTLPGAGFDLLIQAATGTVVGPVTTLHKTVSAIQLVEITGQVFATVQKNGPGIANTPIDPVAGAVVSTSLDSRTATTDASGTFDLQTTTAVSSNQSSQCYTITITAPGLPTFSVHGLWGGTPSNMVFTLSPPSPGLMACGSS